MNPVVGRRWLTAAVAALLCLLVSGVARAHEVRPALLQMTEQSPGVFEATLKIPVLGGAPLMLAPVFPDNMTEAAPPSRRVVPGAVMYRFTLRSDGPIVGGTVSIDGLTTNQIDALVRITLASGVRYSAILRPAAPTYTIPTEPSRAQISGDYIRMGFAHILGGPDHLLFVLGLMCLVRNRWMLLKTVTSFTVAHSITLALATLGYALVNLPSAPDRGLVISLSILFLCRGDSSGYVPGKRRSTSRSIRGSWPFPSGCFHGLRFCVGALSEVGVPQHGSAAGAADVQRGRGTGPARVRGCAAGAARSARSVRRSQDATHDPGPGVHHRHHGGVLDDPARRFDVHRLLEIRRRA